MYLNRSHRKEAILVNGIYYLHSPIGFANTQIARFMGPTWGPSGADTTQVGPMLAPWTLLSGYITRWVGIAMFCLRALSCLCYWYIETFRKYIPTCSSLSLISMGQHSWRSPARAVITSCHANAFRVIRPSQSTDNRELWCFTALVVAPTNCWINSRVSGRAASWRWYAVTVIHCLSLNHVCSTLSPRLSHWSPARGTRMQQVSHVTLRRKYMTGGISFYNTVFLVTRTVY